MSAIDGFSIPLPPAIAGSNIHHDGWHPVNPQTTPFNSGKDDAFSRQPGQIYLRLIPCTGVWERTQPSIEGSSDRNLDEGMRPCSRNHHTQCSAGKRKEYPLTMSRPMVYGAQISRFPRKPTQTVKETGPHAIPESVLFKIVPSAPRSAFITSQNSDSSQVSTSPSSTFWTKSAQFGGSIVK